MFLIPMKGLLGILPSADDAYYQTLIPQILIQYGIIDDIGIIWTYVVE